MKCLKVVTIVAVLSLALAPAAQAQARFQELIELTVRPGQEELFENYMKKIIEAYDKVESDLGWATFEVAVGKPSPTYRIAVPFDKWAEIDNWQEDVLEKAFGEDEAKRIQSEGARAIATSSTRIWEYLPEGSSNVTPDAPVANFYEVEMREVKPEMLPEMQLLQGKWKAAYEAAESKPVVSRWVLRIGQSPGITFRRTAPYNKWSERDEWNIGQILQGHYGEAEMEHQMETLQRSLTRNEVFVSAFRSDLSRMASETPTTEP
jgi:hypothetical protein